ncbi:MAG: TonB-dependent receptor domain-containing protein [Candidatus Acidiferrales bacterium]
MFKNPARLIFVALLAFFISPVLRGQTVTATLNGQVTDATGGSIAKAKVTVLNKGTGYTRSMQASDSGEYSLPALPVGEYTVTVEQTGFKTEAKDVVLQIGQVATLDFSLTVGEVTQKAVVEATAETQEPTRMQVSNVITERQIQSLPVNGREFIDFALLSPAVQIGDTTSGSTDVIIEPVTKLSFAGQNIHFNFIAVDGADDISTASGIQRGTPPQDSVQEFRVINTNYTTDFGRATGGIVNIITRSGTNDWHGSAYEYFRNNDLDAKSILQAPGLTALRQNQYGVEIGGPIQKQKTFIFANYEAQRRGESPFYNSVVLQNIAAINQVKTIAFGLAPENLNVLRVSNYDDGFIRVDHTFNQNELLFLRYFVTDARLTNQSPLNDGFDLPSGFKDNFIRDQSLVGSLTSLFGSNLINEFRAQFARRSFNFPTDTTQPHLEVQDLFTVGVNRGNPDSYLEKRFEMVDNFTINHEKHSISFGGNFDYVSTRESFPLFFPFEADFPGLGAFLGTDGGVGGCPTNGTIVAGCQHPFVIFFERFQAPNFSEPSLNPAIYAGKRIPSAVSSQATGTLDHTYNGLFIQDKWRATSRLTLNGGLRWEFETWPSAALTDKFKNFDPRVGLAYNLGTSRNIVIRSGFGLFHGIIPSPLLMCQIPSCGGTGTFPGAPSTFPGTVNEDALNSTTQTFDYASAPFINAAALSSLLKLGLYPDAPGSSPFGFCQPSLAFCGFLQADTIVRFNKLHNNPYGVQASLGVEFQPFADSTLGLTFMHIKGVHLGSFFDINQPTPSGQVQVFDSKGHSACKNIYFSNVNKAGFTKGGPCGLFYPTNLNGGIPGFTDGAYGVFFEADSRWNSQFDGLLVNFNKRLSHHFSAGFSYTFSKTFDDGPNPSFVLIPQDSGNISAEHALSSDDIRHRFVGNLVYNTPSNWNILLRNSEFSTIVTLQSPQHFTIFAGSDVNGDVFGNNDRVGAEGRNTFDGGSLQTVDMRVGRMFPLTERLNLTLDAEAFNLLNTVNVRFFNTVYFAADFCNSDPNAPGCFGATKLFKDGSPSSLFGTPRAVFNPRQLQFVARFSF